MRKFITFSLKNNIPNERGSVLIFVPGNFKQLYTSYN